MRRNSALAALADVVGVLVFCAVGRRSHAEGLTLTGVAETAWPFLAGTAAGWLLSRGWCRPTAIVPTGAVVWVCSARSRSGCSCAEPLPRASRSVFSWWRRPPPRCCSSDGGCWLRASGGAGSTLVSRILQRPNRQGKGSPQPAERAVGQHDVPAVQCRLLNDQRQA